MKACVVITDTLDEGMLPTLLLALCNQDCDFEYGIYIPGFSHLTPHDQAIISSLRAQYTALHPFTGQGLNRAESINRIAAECKAEILVFVESHCLVPRNFLSRHAGALNNPEVHATVSRRVDLPSHEPVRLQETRLALDISRNFDRGYYFDFHGSAVRYDGFQKLGGLNERLPLFCEFEFGARLHHNNMFIMAMDDLPIWHQNALELTNYCAVVYQQAFERSVIYLINDSEFNRRYFNTPNFTRFLPLLRALRLPLVALLWALQRLARAGFALSAYTTPGEVNYFWFRLAARSSAIRGRIAGLGHTRNKP